MGGNWCYIAWIVLFTQSCVYVDTQDFSDKIQDWSEISDDLSDVVPNPDVVPELADVVPNPADVVSELEDVAPELTDVMPEPEDVVPKPEDGVPEPADVVPDGVPEPADVVPDVVPEPADVVPDVVPEPADVVPEPADVIPDGVPEDVVPELTDVVPEDVVPEDVVPEPEEGVPELPDLINITQQTPPVTTQTLSTTTTTTTTPTATTTTTPTTTPKQPGKTQIERFGKDNYPIYKNCNPGKPLDIDHAYIVQEDELLVWTVADEPEFFYATRWTKNQKCEEYTSYPALLNLITRDNARKCAKFYQVDTNCASQEIPKRYTAYHASEKKIKSLYDRNEIDEHKKNQSLEYIKKLTSYNQQKWNKYAYARSLKGDEEIRRMLNTLHSLDHEDVLYETRPYYCVADCLNRIGWDERQCQGFVEYPEYGYVRKVQVDQVKKFGMQLDNEGTPCKPDMPCTKNLHSKDHYCNGGRACAKYGRDQYGRPCKTVHKGRRGTYCYVEDPMPGDWDWGWTHPAVDTKKNTYCYIG